MHLDKIPDLDRKGLRQFALTIGGVVAVLFGVVLPWLFARGFPLWPWIFGAVFAAWGLAAPMTLQPVYRGWMKFGLLLSKVTTPIILGAVFFIAVLPTGLIRRTFGRDPMARKFDSSAQSYRVPSTAYPKENLEKPY
jgi:hypothetical protein